MRNNAISRPTRVEVPRQGALTKPFLAQASVLQLWAEERKSGVASPAPQTMAAALAAANGAATCGQYKGPHPSLTGGQASLRENFRGWRTDVPAP